MGSIAPFLRFFLQPERWTACRDTCSLARSAGYEQRSAHRPYALLHGTQANAFSLRGGGVKSPPVVLYYERTAALLARQGQLHLDGPAVAGHIRQRFLRNAKQRFFHAQRRGEGALDLDL